MAKRKSKYDTHVLPYIERIPKWRKQGLNEEQVAKKLGIAYSTLNVYKDKYSELSEALKKGKEELIEELEDSLYKKAMGYEYEETETWIEEVDGVKKTRIKRNKRVLPPDTGAIAFALKNLDSYRWRDRKEQEALIKKIETETEKIKQELETQNKNEQKQIIIVDRWVDDEEPDRHTTRG